MLCPVRRLERISSFRLYVAIRTYVRTDGRTDGWVDTKYLT